MLEHKCQTCGRLIKHKGNCLACNIELKKFRDKKQEQAKRKAWQEFFPYQPRFGQDKICDFVSKAIAEKKIAIAEAPYGVGKTASMLASGLASGKKLIFATCDHAVQDTIVQEVLNINEKLNKKLTLAPVFGKKHMCLHLKYFGYEQCDFEKLHQQCPFYYNTYKKGKISRGITEKTEQLLNEIISILKNKPIFLKNKNFVNFVIEKCRAMQLCPYEVMIELAARADVVILDYFHIFTPTLSFMKKRVFDPKNCILFIDEADRLHDRLLDILTRGISDASLYRLKAQIRQLMKKTFKTLDDFEKPETTRISHAEWLFYLHFLACFEEFIAEKEKSIKNEIQAKDEIYIDVNKQEFIDFLEKRLYNFDEITSRMNAMIEKLAIPESYKKAVFRLDEFFDLWQSLSENYFAYILLNERKSLVISPYELASIPLVEADTKYFLADILKNFYSCILFSATIGNKDIFAELLGITDFASFSSEEFNTQNYLVVLKKDVSSIYRERQQNVSRIVKDINFCKKIAQGVLISFPSYDCCNLMLQHLDARPIQDAESQGIYYVVVGGKGSRGINKAAKLNIAYIYGMQIAKPQDYLFNKRKEFTFKKHDPEKALKLIYNDVVNKSCQIAGRIFRDTGKKGIIILADRRYKYDFKLKNFFFDCIPFYFKAKLVETACQEEFEKVMKDFWQKD